MKKLLTITILSIFCCLFVTPSQAYSFGQGLCKNAEYSCKKVGRGESWDSLFPNEEQRTLVRKVNRMNTPLHSGIVIAIPKNLQNARLLDYAPFPHQINSNGKTLVQVNLSRLAWGAYDEKGDLVNWGPVSGGKNYCPDIHSGCRTPAGNFTIFEKQGPGCISHKFPIKTHGGAHMPYCMHFHGGYALHAYHVVPGFNASHGCIRMFLEDAKWLNQDFVQVGSTRLNISR